MAILFQSCYRKEKDALLSGVQADAGRRFYQFSGQWVVYEGFLMSESYMEYVGEDVCMAWCVVSERLFFIFQA